MQFTFLKLLPFMNLQAISPHESTLWWAGWLIPAGECRPSSPELNQIGLKYHLTLTKVKHKTANIITQPTGQLLTYNVIIGGVWKQAVSLHGLAQFRFSPVAITSTSSPSVAKAC